MDKDNVITKYFINGLILKILGGLGLCFIYVYYYGGGDTVNYFKTVKDFPLLLFGSPSTFFSILSGNLSAQNFNELINYSSYIAYYNDAETFSVVRFTSLISPFGLQLYLPTTLILSSISYIGIWKLYKLFSREFPLINKRIAIAILFIPSVLFWGSGIIKDTYTLSATAWMIYSFYKVFIYKEKIILNIIAIVIMVYILFSIRPFMLYISMVGIVLMITKGYLSVVKNVFAKIFTMIFIMIVFWGGGIFTIVSLASSTDGAYSSIDGMLNKAVVSQQDLKRDYYGGNSFDIGEFEPTISGVLSKAPLAINAGLFYPYIWKANNPVMLLAGLENLILLLLTIYALSIILVNVIKKGPLKIIGIIFSHPLIVFSLSYAIPFAFIVGLTTANYGALVRYKIPLIPFYLLSLFIIIHKLREVSNENKSEKEFKFITK